MSLIVSFDPSQSSSAAVRSLFAIRSKLGELLGWEAPAGGLGSRVQTLRDRLPADLRDRPSAPGAGELPFTPLYLTDEEWAVEIANRTVHGVLHFGWVAKDSGGYRGQMAILVKRNGLLGTAYMAAITPFRHLVVYPRMMRDIERLWVSRSLPGECQLGAQREERAGEGAADPGQDPGAAEDLLAHPCRRS